MGATPASEGGDRARAARLRRLVPARLGPAGAALLAMLAAGAALRLVFVLAYRPALLGFPDTGVYLQDAVTDPFWDPLRVVGYGYFLRGLGGLGLNLSAIVLVQHVLGLLSATALWDAVRRVTGSAAAGLLPCAVVLFCGDGLFLEHAVLSESLFTFLTCAAIWCAVRSDDGAVGYVVAAAVAAGLLTTVRLAGIVLIAVIVLWLVRPRAVRRLRARALVRPAIALAAAGVVLVAYLALHADQAGSWSFTNSGSYNLYGRAAVFADCTKFDPPEGTEVLCERTPPRDRPSPDFYNFDGGSPAARAFGGSAQFPPPPADLDKLSSFARAAILGQPVDYARTVLRDLARFVAPESWARQSGNSPRGLRERYFDQNNINGFGPAVQKLAGSQGTYRQPRLLDAMKDYEAYTRVQGPVIVILALLALAAPFVTRGRARTGAILLLGCAAGLIVLPVATVFYDVRYAVPAYGPLAAAAACALPALGARVRGRGRRTDGSAPRCPARGLSERG